MQKIKLAEALLRRKELAAKVAQLTPLNKGDFFEKKIMRKQITESIDEIMADMPKMGPVEFTREFDHYASELRKIDAAIQQANWMTEVEVGDKAMANFADLK